MPPKVLIGVHLTAGSQDVGDTLRALYETTPEAFEVVILVDPAPSEARGVAARLAGLRGANQWRIVAPGGGPASFNRLVAEAADVYVFLEAGTRPGPGWLGLMLDALDADPTRGLAGPTTDWCWNEQGDKAPCRRTAQDVARHARALAAAHGTAWREMTPLYSLSDFCLVVRRAVVEALGEADQAYGRGPCWEMDYGVRAARAGFASVWVKAAYVLRTPWTASRQRGRGGTDGNQQAPLPGPVLRPADPRRRRRALSRPLPRRRLREFRAGRHDAGPPRAAHAHAGRSAARGRSAIDQLRDADARPAALRRPGDRLFPPPGLSEPRNRHRARRCGRPARTHRRAGHPAGRLRRQHRRQTPGRRRGRAGRPHRPLGR